jgi:predicted Zn-ribbon and HTH transcriptional regulator
VTGIPLWAQAESEAVRRMWADAWGLLEEGRDLARELARKDEWEWAAATLADRIDRFLNQATATDEPTPPTCSGCGAVMRSNDVTRCPLCGHPMLRSIPGGDSATTKGTQ